MIMVYHSKSFRDTAMYGTSDRVNKDLLLAMLDNFDTYEYVAGVESDDLNDAYRLTNHIDGNWIENEGIEAFGEMHRSTSVGDLMIAKDGIYVVAPFGFDKIRNFNLTEGVKA